MRHSWRRAVGARRRGRGGTGAERRLQSIRPMASSGSVRARALALAAATFSAHVARADRADVGADPPLATVEARVGYGIAFGGGAGGSVQRYSPMTITALVDQAVL